MATALETTDIAVLKTEMINVKQVLLRMESKLDTQNELYLTRTEFNEFKQRWLFSHSLVGVITSVLVGLTVYFLTRR